MSGSPRSKLGRPSDHLLTPCARLVEQCAVGYLRVQAGGRVRKGRGRVRRFCRAASFVACIARRWTRRHANGRSRELFGLTASKQVD